MSDSYLNPVEFQVGECVVLTSEFSRFARPMIKINPDLNVRDNYEIIEIREANARDEETDLDERAIGATKLKNLRTGTEFDISDIYLDEKDNYWAFFTNHRPELFTKVFKENL